MEQSGRLGETKGRKTVKPSAPEPIGEGTDEETLEVDTLSATSSSLQLVRTLPSSKKTQREKHAQPRVRTRAT